jgi:hypothetical protein
MGKKITNPLMKRIIYLFLTVHILAAIPFPLLSQKPLTGPQNITSSDLKSYVSFLASPLLKGRMNGEEGLDIAAGFITEQAKLSGLKPANGNSFFQTFTVIKNSIDTIKSELKITSGGSEKIIKKPFFQIFPMGAADFKAEGEVIFAGYGIVSEKNNYDDLESLDIEDKILLIMDRAPTWDDCKTCRFKESDFTTFTGLQMKLGSLLLRKPAAIIIVADPKSGSMSMDEQYPSYSGYFRSTMTPEGQSQEETNYPGFPRVIFIHREVADELLKGTGYDLADLQKEIDTNLEPRSFPILNKKLTIIEVTRTEKKVLKNVAGYFEGRHPSQKNEFVIFSAHMDHIGTEGKAINCGADDNASGCAALLSLAKAYSVLKKKPRRSMLFLWLSGEELGLYGSQYYVDNPLVPLKNTVANLNIDMIGRVKGVADTSAENPMTGKNGVFVITGNQSKMLGKIADRTDRSSILDFDYTLGDRNHPLEFFERSDHYNFVRNDIPALFFTSGAHTDYHTPGDIVEKLDFEKMELITRNIYKIGYIVANRKRGIKVDNPFSSW